MVAEYGELLRRDHPGLADPLCRRDWLAVWRRRHRVRTAPRGASVVSLDASGDRGLPVPGLWRPRAMGRGGCLLPVEHTRIDGGDPMVALRSKERLVAAPGFQRWRILPAVLAIELCIGQVYAFSVFTLPLSRVLGITASVPGDWPLTTLRWTFTLAMVGLGLSAAVGGTWVEAAGPRTSGGVGACCCGAGVRI